MAVCKSSGCSLLRQVSSHPAQVLAITPKMQPNLFTAFEGQSFPPHAGTPINPQSRGCLLSARWAPALHVLVFH